MLQVTITKDIHVLTDLKKAMSDFTPFLELVGLGADELIRRNIEHGTDARGNRLMPNAPLTVELKGGLTTPLMQNKFLKNSITHSIETNSVISGSEIHPAKCATPLLQIHQEGRVIRAKNHPYLMIPGNAFTARRRQGAGGLGKTSRVKMVRHVAGHRFTSTETQSIKFIYAKQVTIPPRKVLPEGSLESYPEYVKMLNRRVEQFLKAKIQ